MTTETTGLNTKEGCNFAYDYADRCDCREDDNCGCTFPNNMPHDFELKCNNGQLPKENSAGSCNINKEKIEIQTPNVHIKKDSICICSQEECECTVIRDEYVK